MLSNSFRFASYFNQNTPPLYLGRIDDMKMAGLSKHFISMLLRPEEYAGEDKEGIFHTKVFYSVLVAESPLSKKLQSFGDELEESHSKFEIKTAIDELLITASSLEKPSLVELLIQKGADPNARSCLRGVSAINVANNNQRKETARTLIKFGADPGARETYPMSETPLPSPSVDRILRS